MNNLKKVGLICSSRFFSSSKLLTQLSYQLLVLCEHFNYSYTTGKSGGAKLMQ